MSGGGSRDGLAVGSSVGEAATAAASSATARISLVRRAFLPSPLEELPGPARVDAFARLRGLFTLGAIALDLLIYFAFRGSSYFSSAALGWFVAINVPLLSISTALCWFVLRKRGRWYGPLSLLCMTIEMFTSMVWIQLTGSVSSYFLSVIPVFILAYRLYATYRLGLAAYCVGAIMHVALVVLEQVGALSPASLFVTPPGAIYDQPIFSFASVISIQMMFLGVFILANIVSRALREKETELDAVQRNLDRVVAEVQPGRLSSQTLDGKYRLGELLGRGGMGEVYQAERVDGSGVVAVVIALALAKKPPQRYATPGELARDLRSAFDGKLDTAIRRRAKAIDGTTSAPGFAPTLAVATPRPS